MPEPTAAPAHDRPRHDGSPHGRPAPLLPRLGRWILIACSALLLAGQGGEARAALERAVQAKVELNPQLRREVEATAAR